MVKVAASRKGITKSALDFDSHPGYIGCANGTLELTPDGVKLKPLTEEHYLTLNTGIEYQPDATHTLWTDYLERFLPDEEVRAWLQALVGYSLFGDNAEQIMLVGQGLTGTGKTTLTEGLFAALGGYAGPMEASLLRANADDKARPDILKAMPRRIIIAEELSEFQHLHVDQVKRLTGAGTLSARGMAVNVFVERQPAFTPFIMTNATPTIEGADSALLNRTLVVPFDVQVPRNRNAGSVRRRIVAEAREAILAWAVEGWKRYAEDSVDLRSVPAGALAAQLRFSSGMSDFHQFLADFCDIAPGYSVGPTALYGAYEEWCSQNGVDDRDKLSPIKFGKRMNAMGTEVRKEWDGEKQVWRRQGIALNHRPNTA
jgi:P4 family phage/plasmid primase-like protien